MAFRRDSTDQRRWAAWLADHEPLVLACGLPDLVFESERHWEDFLQDCYAGTLVSLRDVADASAVMPSEPSELKALKHLIEQWPEGPSYGVYHDVHVRVTGDPPPAAR